MAGWTYWRVITPFFYEDRYYVVKNISRLWSSQINRSRRSRIFCDRCLLSFGGKVGFDRHTLTCCPAEDLSECTGINKGMDFFEVSYEGCRENTDFSFEVSLKKYQENTDLLREIIGRDGYKNLDIFQVAYLDSVGWDFDGEAPDRELLSGMDSPFVETLLVYHKKLYPPWEPRKKSKSMELFKIAEKEYLDSLGPKEPEPVKFPNKHFCSEGRKHCLVEVDGQRTCNDCGLVVGPTHYVSEYGCWDRAIMKRPCKEATSYSKVVGFIKSKGVSSDDLFGRRASEVIEKIVSACDAEKPKGKRLPNLNILSYQVCKFLGVEIDKTLLNIPKGKVPNDRCRKLFQKMGLEYVE